MLQYFSLVVSLIVVLEVGYISTSVYNSSNDLTVVFFQY